MGIAATLVLTVVAVRDVLNPLGPRTTSGTCAGANFDVTLAPAPGDDWAMLTASVVIDDRRGLPWQISWPEVSDEPVENIGYTTSFKSAFAVLTDRDDGTSRSFGVRPKGQDAWCRVTANLE